MSDLMVRIASYFTESLKIMITFGYIAQKRRMLEMKGFLVFKRHKRLIYLKGKYLFFLETLEKNCLL